MSVKFEPEIADNAKFWPTGLDPAPKVSGISPKFLRFAVAKNLWVSQAHPFTDVYERYKKIEQSKGQTAKKPARDHFLHGARRNKLAGTISVFTGRRILCLLVPFGRQA